MKTQTLFYTLALLLFFHTSIAQDACDDLEGIDFGPCQAILGYGLIDGECTAISGCSPIVDDVDYSDAIFDSPDECLSNCSNAYCMNLQFVDFGPCEAIIGFGLINGQCQAISGCSPIVNGFDYSPYLFEDEASCSAVCPAPCIDLAGIDFGPCALFLGFTIVNNECVGLSGCGTTVDDVDYSSYFFDTEEECMSACADNCIDLGNIDFGDCDFPLGVALIDGQCVSVSGCDWTVDSVDYSAQFYDSMDECLISCSLPDTCYVASNVDSSAACTEEYVPVCGCDGVTYSNACHAWYFGGVTYWTPGACFSSISDIVFKGLKIYPNPATDLLFIDVTENEEYSLIIYDSVGKKVLSERFVGGSSLDISYIKAGLYFITLLDRNENRHTEKLLIQ